MLLETFHKLTINDQAIAVNNGTFLGDVIENGLVVQLFAVDNFYVDRYYDPLANRILRFRGFNEQSQLMPYLEHVRFNPGD
ncbi:MAG: hypothetical protein ABI203_05615 [Mucilaginibacter sp.]